MLHVLSITSVIFLLIALGRFIVWRGIIEQGEVRVLGAYVVNIALPALIFSALTSNHLAEAFVPGYLAIYALGSLIMLLIGYTVSRSVLKLSSLESSFQGLAMGCCNSGFVGFPILHIALPSVAPLVFAHNVVVENLLMIPLALALAERARSQHLSGGKLALQIGRRLSANPMIWAMVIGIAVSFSGLPVPSVLDRGIDLLATSSSAVSLIVIGGSLANLSLRSVDIKVLSVVAGKLLMMPLVVAGLAYVLMGSGLIHMPQDMHTAMIVSAAVPTLSIYPILALAYGVYRGPAVAMALATALSFITLTAALLILGVAA